MAHQKTDPSSPLQQLYSNIEQWLTSSNDGNVQFTSSTIFEAIFSFESPISLSQVLRDFPDIVNITEQQGGFPVMNWPWLGTGGNLSDDDDYLYYYFILLCKEFKDVRNASFYIYGNGIKVCHKSEGHQGKKFYICNNEEFFEEAPAGKFRRWLNSGTKGGITANEVQMDEVVAENRLTDFNPSTNDGYRDATLEVAFVCALAENRSQRTRRALSVLISTALVQAVYIAQGGSLVGCHEKVVQLCHRSQRHTIGGQIAVLASLYARILLPPTEGVDDRLLRLGSVHVWRGIPPADDDMLSNNMYWIRHLGDDKSMALRSSKFSVVGHGNSLYFKDWNRLALWGCICIVSIALSVISVVFQEVEWAEKVEKFLNLLFTATVATIIGVASVHPEANWLYNLFIGRRKITSTTDVTDEEFACIIEFLEEGSENGRFVSKDQSSWVGDNNHGTTQLGRPVHLNELSLLKLSVSPTFELCVMKTTGGMPRVIDLTRGGVCVVSGPVGTPRDEPGHIFLESRLLVGS